MQEDAAPLSEPVFQLLLALAAGPCHGYGVIKAVEAATGGRVRLGPGTLYGAIKRLREAGWIRESAGDAETDSRRRYYELTPAGMNAARRELHRLRAVVTSDAARALLGAGGT